MKTDHHSKFSNLSNWKEEAPENIKASTGFEPVTSAIPVRCSTNLFSNCLNSKIYYDDQSSL